MTVFLSAFAFGLASLVIGAALSCRRQWTWTAPATGLAAIVLIAVVTVRLPGHGATAAAAVMLALAAAVVALARARSDLRPLLTAVPVVVIVLGFCALPFLANDRVGELGASMLDDIWFHMRQADVLRDEGTSRQVLADGYPIGPHAAVAALAEGTGIGVAPAFTGLTLAAPMLLALVALAGIGKAPLPLRIAGAALVGVPYLVVAYVAEGAFKEPLLALFFLGFALTAREAFEAGRLESRHTVALVLTASAGVAVFGLAALLWPAAALGWLALIALGPRARRLRLPSRVVLAAGVAAVAVLGALALAAVASGFFDTGPGRFVTDNGVGGNFVGQLSPPEALGVWPRPDFRLATGGKWWLEIGAAFAAVLVVAGLVRAGRRDRALLAAALAGLTVYVVARPTTLAYFSGKALAVASPVLALAAVSFLLAELRERRRWPARTAVALAAGTFALLALYSSALALRAAHVRPHERGADLSAFRPLVRNAPVLYLARDAFAGWELRGSRLAGFQPAVGPGLTRLAPVFEKTEPAPPTAVDVDSVGPRGLDGYRYVITPRTSYASVLPPNLRPVARTRWSVLWERTGPTPPRMTLSEGEAPGAVLDCRSAPARALARAGGVAYVRPRPVVGVPGATLSGRPLVQTLDLGPGRWEISLRWFSDMPLEVRLGGERRDLPAYLSDRASFVAVGRVDGGGPLRIEVRPRARRRLDVVRTVLIGEPVAVRVDRPGRVLPLQRACGRYVDWYRTGG